MGPDSARPALLGVAVLTVLVVLLTSPLAASQGVAPYAGHAVRTWSPTWSTSTSACGKARATLPRFSIATLKGDWAADASTSSCTKSHGGFGTEGIGQAQAGLTAELPISIPVGTGGVNVTWSTNLSWGVIASLPNLNSCLTTKTVSKSYESWIASWYNSTSVSTSCSASVYVSLSASVFVEDLTTASSYYPSNSWAGLYEFFDYQNYSYHSVGNYSNASYWKYNSTSWYSDGGFSGLTGTGVIAPANSPTWFVNGTFVKNNRYELEASIVGEAGVSLAGLKGSSVRAYLDAAGKTGFTDLSYVAW